MGRLGGQSDLFIREHATRPTCSPITQTLVKEFSSSLDVIVNGTRDPAFEPRPVQLRQLADTPVGTVSIRQVHPGTCCPSGSRCSPLGTTSTAGCVAATAGLAFCAWRCAAQFRDSPRNFPPRTFLRTLEMHGGITTV